MTLNVKSAMSKTFTSKKEIVYRQSTKRKRLTKEVDPILNA